MAKLEPILNWSDTCRFRFVDTRDYISSIKCISPNGTRFAYSRKYKYLSGVIKAAENACDENDVIAKQIANSAYSELINMSAEAMVYEYGCVCPFASCVSELSANGTISCGCVKHSSTGVYRESSYDNTSAKCLYPLTNGNSSFESEIDFSNGRCQCDNGRHSYLDPISFQWSCICDDDNDECIDTGTYPPWTILDNLTYPDVWETISTDTPSTTLEAIEKCSKYADHNWKGECVCNDPNIHEMKDDGECHCIGYNFVSRAVYCYLMHVFVALLCTGTVFLLLG